MVLRRGFTSTVLLLLVLVLAGCSSLFPGIGSENPPVDTRHGALDIHVDLTEVQHTPQMPELIRVTLSQGSSTSAIHEELIIQDNAAKLSIRGIATGSWDAVLRLFLHAADTDPLATMERYVEIIDGRTASLHLQARSDGTNVWLVVDDGDGDGDPGTDPGDDDGDGDPGTDPGDGDGDGDGDDGSTTDPGTDPGDGGGDGSEPVVTRDVRYIQSGNRTETRTEVYIIRSSVPGPTVMVVGGVHGGETSGWIVAGEVARTWDIDRGTLVVLPEANKDAVNRRVRTGRDGRDMNRAFPFGRPIDRPTDWLMAREIWRVVEEFKPDALIDLHEGWGLREANDRFPGGTLSVGQTIITYPVGDAERFTDHVIRVLNREHNPFYGTAGYTYNFRKIGPPVQGSLAYKAGRDLRIPAFIVEPTQGRAGRHQTTVEQRSKWHRAVVEEFLRWYGVRD